MFIILLPVEVICTCIFPHLSLVDLQALDTAFTNKYLRPYLCSLWSCYIYSDMLYMQHDVDDINWLQKAGVGVLRMTITLTESDIDTVASATAILSRFRSLKQINIYGNVMPDEVLMQLAQSSSELEVLRLHGPVISSDGFINLIKHCKHLRIINCRHTEDAVRRLCDYCPHLRHIHFDEISDISISLIAKRYPCLHSISVYGRSVTDAGLLTLAGHCGDTLHEVYLSGCSSITSRGLAALWKGVINLTAVHIGGIGFISDDDIKTLVHYLPQLVLCDLELSINLTDAAVIAVAEHCLQLNTLCIRDCHFMSDVSLFALRKHCHGLISIDISFLESISDDGVLGLAEGCPLLQEFIADGCTGISDASVKILAQLCCNLCKVVLSDCGSIGFEAISAIAENCPLISELDVSSGNADDACLYVIAEHCRNIAELNVSFTKVSDGTAVQALIKSCRMLRVLNCNYCHVNESMKEELREVASHLKSFEFVYSAESDDELSA